MDIIFPTSDPDPDEVHTHCMMGLFHDVEPIHKHGQCKNCGRQRRCASSDANWKLLRCAGCGIATYCSKECQKDHWRTDHRDLCKFLRTHSRDVAIALSGNPNAWNDFVAWSEYHHTSLVNAALACYLHMKHHVDDVTSKHLLAVPLQYLNDPSLPPEKKFRMPGALFPNKDDPEFAAHCAPVFAERHLVVPLGKRDYPTDYWGMGSYLLVVCFGAPEAHPGGMQGVSFWKHFAIDDWHANARLSCRHPVDQLKENLEQGKRLRFCCGNLEGTPTCCCGGWAHDVSGAPPQVPRKKRRS